MNTTKIMPIRRFIAVCAAALLIAAMATVAYAADVGGIQRTIQIWVHGDQTNAVLNIDGGSYSLSYEDENGDLREVFGGGVAIDSDGDERPLTEEEILEQLYAPEVEYKDDGTVWVYYLGQRLDITDRFQDGICYVQLKNGDQILYMTVKYQNGYSTSPHGYVSPAMFN